MYTINDLIIEVTRRCNLSCDHCLRGEPQNINLDTNYVSKLFNQIDYLSNVTFTGGEPSLVPETISKIIDIAKEKNVTIGSFFIVTNAIKISKEFMEALLKCYLYCDSIEDEQICLEISNDEHHDYEYHDPNNTKKLLAYRFARKKNKDDYFNYSRPDKYNNSSVLNEGRAALNYGGKEVSISEISIYDEIIEDTIYLNCLGNIVPNCDLSFEHQDDTDIIIGNVNSPDFDLIKAIKAYNKHYELELV